MLNSQRALKMKLRSLIQKKCKHSRLGEWAFGGSAFGHHKPHRHVFWNSSKFSRTQCTFQDWGLGTWFLMTGRKFFGKHFYLPLIGTRFFNKRWRGNRAGESGRFKMRIKSSRCFPCSLIKLCYDGSCQLDQTWAGKCAPSIYLLINNGGGVLLSIQST